MSPWKRTMCQCEIVKNSTGVFLRDKSSNGTWVNGNKVGKDKVWPLEHNSEICFAGSNKKVFVFMSMEATSDSFPPELTTKYTVSKVLGKGACGEVRLGFRVPDLHRSCDPFLTNHKTQFLDLKTLKGLPLQKFTQLDLSFMGGICHSFLIW